MCVCSIFFLFSVTCFVKEFLFMLRRRKQVIKILFVPFHHFIGWLYRFYQNVGNINHTETQKTFHTLFTRQTQKDLPAKKVSHNYTGIIINSSSPGNGGTMQLIHQAGPRAREIRQGPYPATLVLATLEWSRNCRWVTRLRGVYVV